MQILERVANGFAEGLKLAVDFAYNCVRVGDQKRVSGADGCVQGEEGDVWDAAGS